MHLIRKIKQKKNKFTRIYKNNPLYLFISLLQLLLAGLSLFALEFQEERDSNPSRDAAPDANNASVTCAGNAIEALLICLRQLVAFVDAGVHNVFRRRRIDHILRHETLDCLVARDHFAAVEAVHGLFPAGIHLRTAAVPPLLGHRKKRMKVRPNGHQAIVCVMLGEKKMR